MARYNRRFHFVPLGVRSIMEEKAEGGPYVKFSKAGVVNFSSNTLAQLGVDVEKGSYVRLYCDPAKRAFAFSVSNRKSVQPNARFLKPYKNNQGYYYATLGVRAFLSEVKNAILPTPRLPLEKYNEMYVAILPRTRRTAAQMAEERAQESR